MATLPQASVSLANTSSAFASGVGLLTVLGVVAKSADSVPRVMGSTQDLLNQYGYSKAVDYASIHFQKTRKPVLFVGLPVATVGKIGSLDTTGVVGTCSVSVTADTSGVMEDVQASIAVAKGGTVGTDQISFDLSLDGGFSVVRVLLGTNSSYTIPNVGMVLNFGAGTLVAGDIVKWQTSEPMWGSTAMSTARTNLAAQQNLSRNWLVVGDLPSSTFANYVVAEVNNYETSNERFVYARANVVDCLPAPTMSRQVFKMTGSPVNLTFAASGHTITRDVGSFVTDGFAIGQVVSVTGSASNNGTIGALTNVSATVLTFGSGVVNEGPTAGISVSGSPGLTFAASGHTITLAGGGSFVNDGFATGQTVTISGTASNNVSLAITTVTATVMTFGSGLANEGPIAESGVTITALPTMGAWMSSEAAAFAVIDAQKRIDLGAGRARYTPGSPITNWQFRRPAQWPVSIREYQHDVQIPTWRKADQPLDGWSLTDNVGNALEFDEAKNGGGLAARFTVLRSYNAPIGAFVALSLTRETEGSLLSRTHNMSVADIAETVIQSETENAIGTVLELNSDGTGTDASLKLIEQRVNRSLQVNLLQQFSEGPRASSAVWTASRTDILNVPGATLHGSCVLNLNGTLENINTVIRVQTAGA